MGEINFSAADKRVLREACALRDDEELTAATLLLILETRAIIERAGRRLYGRPDPDDER